MDCTNPRYLLRPDLKKEDFGYVHDVPWNEFKEKMKKQDLMFRVAHPELFMKVGCYHCLACKKQRTRENALRLLYEMSTQQEGVFITLTYNDEHLPLYQTKSHGVQGTLDKEDLKKFWKRLRERLDKDTEIKYYACGEYGKKFRPHYHAIVYGLGLSDTQKIKDSWNLGFVDVKPIGVYQIAYVAGYVQKKLYSKLADEVYEGRIPPFSVSSHYLGLRYLVENSEEIFNKGYCSSVTGKKNSIPRYYLNKDSKLKHLAQYKSSVNLELMLDEISEMTMEEIEEKYNSDRLKALISENEASSRMSHSPSLL